MPVPDDGDVVIEEGAAASMPDPVTWLRTEGSAPAEAEQATSTVTEALTSTASYLARAFGTTAGLRGLAVEGAWCATHLVDYSFGLLREHLDIDGSYAHLRTESLSPTQCSLIVSDMDAAGTPVLLVHGLMDNRSVYTQYRRALRKHGFGLIRAVNYGALTQDIRTAAYELRRHVNRLRERTGADRIHIVGHSLGGLIARYYVQRLGGDQAVHTVATVGTPHSGTMTAYLMLTPMIRQLTPGSDLLAELAEPAPSCRTQFLAVWSELDQLIVPQYNAQLIHPDLTVNTLQLHDVGHLSLPIDARTVQWIATALPNLDDPHHT